MKKGTLSRLIKDAGLTIDEFVNLLGFYTLTPLLASGLTIDEFVNLL